MYSFSILILLHFIALALVSRIILTCDIRHPCLVSDFNGNVSKGSALTMMFTGNFVGLRIFIILMFLLIRMF